MFTNFPNGLSSLGIPVLGGLPITSGTYFFVNSSTGDDGNSGLSMDSPLKTVASAYAKMTTNKFDVCVLMGSSSHALASMLTISKNRCIFVGLDGTSRAYGQRTKLSMGVTTAATDVFAVKNTGIGNVFKNIKFLNANTKAENVAAFGEGGEYTVFDSCEFYDSTELDSDTEAEMVLNGDSTQFRNCTFGSLADSVDGNQIRPAILLTKATVAAGKVSRDVLFENCNFWKNAGGTTTAMIKGGATDVERVMEFRNCRFMANSLGSAPAVAIDVATLTVGQIITTGSTCSIGCTKTSTAVGVFNCTPTYVATATIGIQST